MAIPVGTLVCTGFGDSGSMRFLSPSGVIQTQPATHPTPGSGVDGIIALKPNGRYGIIGGNTPNFGTTGVGIFNTDFSVRAEGAGPNQAQFSIARDDADQFYGIKSSTATIVGYGDDGSEIGRWETGGTGGISVAVNGAGTIAYYVTTADRSTVKSWDLSGDSDLGTFATDGTLRVDHTAMCALSNGDVLIGWGRSGNTGNVKQYSAAGSLLHTYALSGTNPTPIAVTPGLTDSTCWVVYYDDALTTFSGVTYVEIQLGTGSVLHAFSPAAGEFEFDSSICVDSQHADLL
jgi:hypothetical protein